MMSGAVEAAARVADDHDAWALGSEVDMDTR